MSSEQRDDPQPTPADETLSLAKAYDPRETEPRWYRFWEENGFFTASAAPDDKRETYTVAIPPPNVTGSLHMGHACRTAFEDVLVRYHRMCGYNTLWVPGIDHAGIATQVAVERQLAREGGKSRHDLGREKFIERVWQWKAESGGRILKQLRVLGASCDWTRERFTMDEGLSRAVRHAFVSLYREGLIYRDTRLVNWDVQAQTVLSDLEVENEENVQGELFDFAYPVEGGGEIVVSTTRPETMLGDTAIAVHPDDPRYTHLHGKFALHPFVSRKVRIVTDAELVDPKFGTGAVKVTPAHDWNDFATGKRHQLEEINIFNKDGTLNEQAGPFKGLERFAARKAVKAKLDEMGLARGTKTHTLTLPRSQRSGTIVEPIISTQWFMQMKPLAEPAIAAVESGKTRIVPEHWEKTYFHWMRNIQDWCISRQLWWGHSIPAWYCEKCSHAHVALEAPEKCEQCGGAVVQDEDVLDTWFSSGLWPFSTLGWPDKTADLARFYPTSDMETGYDILFFWVARMMMMGLHFTGEVPFRRVLLSGLVTDERGEKMSKLKGNVVDPLDVINGATLDHLIETAKKNGARDSGIDYLRKTYPEGFAAYGADALRLTLLSYSPQTTKIALSIKRIEGYRNFANKLWNAARYVLMNLQQSGVTATQERPAAKHFANRWILSRLAVAIDAMHSAVRDYRMDEATSAVYHFVWQDFCDWYLELSKPLLASNDPTLAAETRAVLVHTLETTLRVLHPMMPFITEEIWQRVPKADGLTRTLVLARYPRAASDAARDETVEREMSLVQAVSVAARALRSERDIHPRLALPLHLRTDDSVARAVLDREQAAIASLVNATVSVEAVSGAKELENSATSLAESVTLLVPLAGLVDDSKEKERVTRQLQKLEKDLAAISKKLDNEGFVARAPAEVVAKERERRTELEEAKRQLEAALVKLG
ncbi:MAG TPA: valine--tRNA ligase [Polyangiales bacterium]|nr:valine--tRNA ligase [Polyangiales bacterium]